MNGLQIFKNNNFGEIRTKLINNEPYLCLVDICKILDLEQASRVKTRLNEDGVTISKVIDSLGRTQDAIFINESNLYKVIFQSRKPEAEKFTEWVTSEVLPSIRKTGSYIKPMTQAEIIAQQANLLVEMERKVTEANVKIEKTSEKLDKALDVFSAPVEEDWKHSINSAINKMVIDCQLNYQVFRAKLYEELEYLAKVDLEARQRNLRNRLYDGGATKTQCRAVTKLDVISRDEKLRLIFDGIVKKYQVRSLRGA